MGLDITYYSRLKLDETVSADDRDDIYETHMVVYANSDFPGRAEPLVNRGCYTYEGSDGFRAGSYGGYNNWRDWLAKMAGYPAVRQPDGYRCTHAAGAWAATSGPFWELINFADNEGTIGSVAATKLAADFAEWDERAKAASEAEGEPYFYEKYVEWRKAFEAAADGGAVDFH